jgi:hypothetical protein
LVKRADHTARDRQRDFGRADGINRNARWTFNARALFCADTRRRQPRKTRLM